MTISDNVVAFLAAQRMALDELEKFVETPGYLRFLAVAIPMLVDEDPEPWLSQWLIEPVYGLKGLPIHLVSQPGGLDRVEQHLNWVSTFLVA